MILSKQAFRDKAKKRRHDLYDSKKNETIVQRFLQSPEYQNSQTIMMSSAIADEIDLSTAIAQARVDGKEVFLPVVDTDHIYPAPADAPLKKGPFGILEPCAAPYTGKLDLIVVPGLAFDEQGYRVGYGGGYYDRFLKTQDALSLSLTPEALIDPDLPHDEMDVPVDVLITEQRILRKD